MSLGAAPTRAAVFAALHANALYALHDSVSEATDYYEAIHYALTFYPKSAHKGQEEFEFDTIMLNERLKDVAGWLRSYSGGSDLQYATRYCS